MAYVTHDPGLKRHVSVVIAGMKHHLNGGSLRCKLETELGTHILRHNGLLTLIIGYLWVSIGTSQTSAVFPAYNDEVSQPLETMCKASEP